MSTLETAVKNFSVAVAFDDTNTYVRVYTNEPFVGDVPVAEGRARRMKGDERNPAIGVALATGRAFEMLVKRELEYAESLTKDS